MKVLIVEDSDEHIAFITRGLMEKPSEDLTSSLNRRGIIFTPISATDIEIARTKEDAILSLLDSKIYDLLILDLHIPSTPGDDPDEHTLHGFDVLSFVRRRLDYYLPVVVFSGALKHGAGAQQMWDVLESRKYPPPDEILAKAGDEGARATIDALQRKLAPFLVDLDDTDIARLQATGVIVPGNSSRRVFRLLKRLARATRADQPLPDVLLLGENGVGKSTFARAYHVLRRPVDWRLGFMHVDLGTLDIAGSAPSLRLFGGTAFNFDGRAPGYRLGAFTLSTAYYTETEQGTRTPCFYRGQLVDGAQPAEYPMLELTPGLYPTSTHGVDYERSGTLFLDEVVNISPEIQNMLLQAIGYDLRRRHVTTTGLESRIIQIGPALVMATRKGIDALDDEDELESQSRRTWHGTRDYRYRIDQVRVEIPPLRKRRNEVLELLRALVEDHTEFQV